ncbi:hypothetical protein STANM309S_05719 [Streptomyces tanashiensis]
MSATVTGAVLREMRWWDIEPVLALEAELFPEDAWSEGMFWSELAHARGPRATRHYVVAEDPADGRLVGYAGLAAAGLGDVQRPAGGPVPVISEIPTREKIVFITIDDGAEKDPEFVRMMKDLKIPVTMFLTDAAIRADYPYFAPLVAQGHGLANHTLTHPNLRTLGPEAQRREICGQQTKLKQRYGTTPRLFRPPYGNWNEATRAAAGECGVDAIVLWRESMQIKNMQYQRGDRKLHPGDIILAHFRGPSELERTMTEMTATMLRKIQEQGFTVARLEDYV